MSSRFQIFVSLLVIFQAMALASSGDVTGGAAIDLRASSLSSQGSGWVNLGTAGGYYLAQDKNDPPPYGTTGDIPWTSGWVDDAESDGDSHLQLPRTLVKEPQKITVALEIAE